MRRVALTLVAAVCLVLGAAGGRLFAQDEDPAAAEADAALAAKQEKVRHLLRLQGGEKLGQIMLDKMSEQFERLPGMPPGFMQRFRDEADVKEIIELSVPSYVKHVDEATLDAAIAFFESEHGRKLAAKLPEITVESMDAGMAWGQKLAMELLEDESPDEDK